MSNAWDRVFTRGDCALLRRALFRDWQIDEPTRREILRRVWSTLRTAEHDHRLSLSLCRTVVSMGEADLREQRRVIQSILEGKQS